MEKHLLIVESDLDELRKIREMFAREGYNIMTATDKETVVEILQNIPVKLVIGAPQVLMDVRITPAKRTHDGHPRDKKPGE
ncbi:MAG: hypothetical protein K9N46_11810 [Candidatus Marinimicrobia bacterium]|nr:hypothetical protein [Candidatus Neomarinimicrobiota bacterium]MCF7827353.1 hypothetical protein [Candidatus Neomarinimicrobiota bacterium]MCF7881414.1 hypothetical protein [Candidatus Neomarinimicrobiota bacterium]